MSLASRAIRTPETVGHFERNEQGVVVLDFFHLRPKQVDALYDLMLVNKPTELHSLRNRAGAFMKSWDPTGTHIAITVYKPDREDFVDKLGEYLGLDITISPMV